MSLYPSYAAIHSNDTNISSQNLTTLENLNSFTIDFAVLTWNDDMMIIYNAYNPLSTKTSQFIYVGASISIAVASDTITDFRLTRTPSGNEQPSSILFRTAGQDIISTYTFIESDVGASFSFMLYRGNEIAQNTPIGTVVLFPTFFEEIINQVETLTVNAPLVSCYTDGTKSSTTANVANFATYLSDMVESGTSSVIPDFCDCISDNSIFNFGYWCEAQITMSITHSSTASNTAGILSLSTINLVTTRNVPSGYPNAFYGVPSFSFVSTTGTPLEMTTMPAPQSDGSISYTFISSDSIFTETWTSPDTPMLMKIDWPSSPSFTLTTPWRVVSNCEEAVIASLGPTCSVGSIGKCLLTILDSANTLSSSCECTAPFFDPSCRIFLQSSSYTPIQWSILSDFSTILKQNDYIRIAFAAASGDVISYNINGKTYTMGTSSGTMYSDNIYLGSYVSWTRDEAQSGTIKTIPIAMNVYLNNIATPITTLLTLSVKPYTPADIISTTSTTSVTSFDVIFADNDIIPTDAYYSLYLAYSTVITTTETEYTLLQPLYCVDISQTDNNVETTIQSHYLLRNVTTARCYLPLFLPPFEALHVILQPVFTNSLPQDHSIASWRYSSQFDLLYTPFTLGPTTICTSLSYWELLSSAKSDYYTYPINTECFKRSISTQNNNITPTQTADIKKAILAQEQFIQSGIAYKQCLPSCPTGLILDSSCQRCICSSDSCSRYTRVAQVFLNNEIFSTTSIDNIPTINRYISQEYYIQLATTFFADVLHIARTPVELAIYSSSDTSYFGLEEITVTPITAVLNKNAAQQLLIYITLAIDGSNPSDTAITTRFKVISDLLLSFQNSPILESLTTTSNDLSLLGSGTSSYASTFNGQLFQPYTPPPGVAMYLSQPFIPIDSIASAQTWCYQQQLCTSCTYAPCPTTADSAFADLSLVNGASFWSSCDANIGTNSNPEYTSLNVTCTDIYGQVSINNPKWCVSGFYQTFPIYSNLSCSTPSIITPYLSPISLPDDIDTATTSSRLIAWHYIGPVTATVLVYLTGVTTKYSQLLTNPSSTDTTIQPWSTKYPILLGRYSAQAQFAQIPISNSLFESTTTGTVYIVMEEYPSIRLNITNSLVINHVDLCTNSPCATDTEICFPPTGTCSCPDGMSYSSSNVCQNTCTDTCGSHGTCVRAFNSTLQKYVSTCECSDGWSGTSCQVSGSCPTSLCSNHGWKAWDETSQKCVDPCQCYNSWSSTDNCATCSLRSTCSSTGTLNSSYTSCSSCACRQGYSGTLCSIRAMYGTMLFSNVTSSISNSSNVQFSIESVPQNSTIVTTLNVSQSLSSMSVATLTTLQQDMASSLNIDTSRLSIQRVAQSDIKHVDTSFFDVDDDYDDDDDDGDLISYLKIVNETITRRYNVTFLIQASSNDGASFSSTSSTSSTSSALFSSSILANNPSSEFVFEQIDNDFDIFSMFPTATVPTSISDLYQAWSDVQSNLPSTPIGNTQATQDLGQVENAQDAYDPQCVASATVTCPDGTNPFAGDEDDTTEEPSSGGNPFYPPSSGSSSSSKSSTTLIIIVVVVVVGGGAAAIILLLILLCILRSKEMLCFAPSDDKPDELIDPMSGMDLNATTSRNGTSSTKSKSNQNNVSKSSTELTMMSDTSIMTTISENGSIHDSTSKASSVVTSVDASDENLPPDWEKVKHPVTGAMFYVNKKTLVSQNHSPNEQGESAW